ncbi:Retrovirus-related Pol polyprotein from transposon TNT 1-94 [Podarcis lilfordi]|uniref:Retrovirus-related Pol polyprotein from transposon TNT 1-94 n=1 Tax=Podarcis lilfordi TaxID=74358 RepID=A0AA35LDJ4_9SAUR|nr:Retrovirus-related Pol polyprotein from transposon TNT 1-94 [Podarcis lilfordi]
MSHGKNKYILTFIDYYSRYYTTYLLKDKSETVEKLKMFVASVKNQFRRKPQAILSDSGDVKHLHTTPFTPEQSGIAERKNCSLMEMVRCMQNRLPTKAANKAAFELWFGRVPNISHIRVFGTKAFAYVPA